MKDLGGYKNKICTAMEIKKLVTPEVFTQRPPELFMQRPIQLTFEDFRSAVAGLIPAG